MNRRCRGCCSRYLRATGNCRNKTGWLSRQSAVRVEQEVIRNPGLTAEQSHELWAARMRGDGWTYGPEKDFGQKTHPTLLPFSKLPAEQQLKDRLFIAIVRALAPGPGRGG
jgi:RyR domain